MQFISTDCFCLWLRLWPFHLGHEGQPVLHERRWNRMKRSLARLAMWQLIANASHRQLSWSLENSPGPDPACCDFFVSSATNIIKYTRNSVSETIESDQRHRAASWINIQRSGSACRISVKDHPGSTSWTNGRDGRDEGFFKVSFDFFFRFHSGFFGVSSGFLQGRPGWSGGSPQGYHLYRPIQPM